MFQNLIPSSTRSIIFDLGGVILDLAPRQTAQAFSALAGIPLEEVYHAYRSNPEFNGYERGEMEDATFRNFIRKTFSVNATDVEIDLCWNAMLHSMPKSRLDMLEKLKRHFNVLALSNINGIHLNYIEEKLLRGGSLKSFFHQAYYSFLINMRKPEPEIYQHVLKSSNLAPDSTVFLDDNTENLEAANKFGIHTIHITHPDQVLEIFKQYE